MFRLLSRGRIMTGYDGTLADVVLAFFVSSVFRFAFFFFILDLSSTCRPRISYNRIGSRFAFLFFFFCFN